MGSSLTFGHALFHFPPHSFTEFVPALWDLGIRGYFDTKQCHHFMMEQMQFIHVAVPQHPPHAGSEISPLSAKTKKRCERRHSYVLHSTCSRKNQPNKLFDGFVFVCFSTRGVAMCRC